MKAHFSALALLALSIAQPVHAAAPTADAMRWHRRLLIFATPTPQDRLAVEQRRILDEWSRGAADRDISLVEVSGGRVVGLADDAASLRQRYAIKPGHFEVLLIGKDGTVAMRSGRPFPASTLQRKIDAMPMRRAGER